MLCIAEFKVRFINRMSEILGEEESRKYFTSIIEQSHGAYEMYVEDPDDLTPEEYAEAEISE